MSESKYESVVRSIPTSANNVYQVLGNLQNLEKVRDQIPEDKIQELEISPDTIRMKVDGLGQKVAFSIVDRIENDTIKYGIDGFPLAANVWIQLKQVSDNDTRVKITLKADIPVMFKMMLGNKIQQGIDDAAERLTQFPYEQWLKA